MPRGLCVLLCDDDPESLTRCGDDLSQWRAPEGCLVVHGAGEKKCNGLYLAERSRWAPFFFHVARPWVLRRVGQTDHWQLDSALHSRDGNDLFPHYVGSGSRLLPPESDWRPRADWGASPPGPQTMVMSPGSTALHVAAVLGFGQIFFGLLSLQESLLAERDGCGRTAMDMAQLCGHGCMVSGALAEFRWRRRRLLIKARRDGARGTSLATALCDLQFELWQQVLRC
eukprot:CAMPEP_0194525830 /NCGR_PEP_ID=MMETSP0253-20130528/61443_1 /TAXON_ID=2966 /ORGANISM="Noctiluca scintillans" /LENGTH=226 /DNA_ID=CAMNT_0039370601 /DNA_START=9 /DNA_END=686 /DNA_ORIENTATION=+